MAVNKKKKLKQDNSIGRKRMLGSFCFKQKRRNLMRTKTKDARPSDPEILFLDMCPREVKIYGYTNICTYVQSSFAHNSQKVETQIFHQLMSS